MQQNDTIISSSNAVTEQPSTQKIVPKSRLNHIQVQGIKPVKSDSDSIRRNDSLAKIKLSQEKIPVKTTQTVVPSGYEGKLLPSSPHTEPWVFILLVILLVFFVNGIHKSRGLFVKSITSFFKRKDNLFSDFSASINLFEYKASFTIFFLGVYTLFVYALLFDPSKVFDLFTFLKLLAISVAFSIIKVLLIDFVGNVFFNIKQIKIFKESYLNLTFAFSVVFFIMTVLFVYQPLEWNIRYGIISVVLFALFYILLVIKVFLNFYTKILDIFYIFLYLCTLEILPLVILFRTYNLIM